MKNLINNIFLVTLVFFIPLFLEGKSTEKKSFIQEIKEKLTNEKEKIEAKAEEKKQEKVKKEEKIEVKSKEKGKEKEKNEYKEKKEVGKQAEEESRIKIVKKNIEKEKEKIEARAETEKKNKEKEKDKYKQDYVNDYNRKYHKRYKDYYYPDIYWTYDNPYYDVIYDEYTYVDDSDLIYERPIYTEQPRRRTAFLISSVEAAYLGKDIRDTYGVTAKISANLFALHFNCFYQNIFSSEESLTLYSINGGYSFVIQNFILTPFVGAFYIEPLEEARLSYGANLQIFFPENINLDLYTINSSYGSLNFNNFSASLNREFYRFNFGLGFNYNNYAGVSFSGPLAKLSFWL
jgi:hypothetical protein